MGKANSTPKTAQNSSLTFQDASVGFGKSSHPMASGIPTHNISLETSSIKIGGAKGLGKDGKAPNLTLGS